MSCDVPTMLKSTSHGDNEQAIRMLITPNGVGYADLRSSCGQDMVYSDICEPYEGSTTQMRVMFDHGKSVQLCKSQSPGNRKPAWNLVSALCCTLLQLETCVARF